MADARAAIFGAVRTALGPAAAPDIIARESAALLADPAQIRPGLDMTDLPARFAERASRAQVGATVDRVTSLAALPAAVRHYLSEQALPPRIAVQPRADLRALDWSGLETHADIARDETAAVGLAEWGVAETGSLVFRSGPETPVLFHFLPLHHIVAMRTATIVPYLEDLAAALPGPQPRNLNLITGASGTTDIEGVFVRGAHGPGFLHIIFVS